MYTEEDRQKPAGHARTTSYQRQIRFLCITWLPIELAWQSQAGAGYTLPVLPAFENQAATVLFLQINPWSFEERHILFIHLR